MPPDSKVKLVVSRGHGPVQVPDVRGLSFADAKTALEAQHFTVGAPVSDFDNTGAVPKDKVIGTDPGANSRAPYGSAITVHVSKGPDLVPVPDLKGKTLTQAQSILVSGPRAVRLQKALMRDWERLPLTEAIQQGIRACVEARRTDEPKRMMTAFMNRKRK